MIGEVLKVSAGGANKIWLVRTTPDELVELAHKPFEGPTGPIVQGLKDDLTSGNWQSGGHWSSNSALGGARNLADIDAMMQNGWPEGVAKARAMIDDLGQEVPPALSTRRRRVVGEDGTDPIIEAWIDKDLLHLWERRRKFTTHGHKIIQIAVGWGGTSIRSGDQLFWGGAAALVLTELLEAAGYGVEVHAYNIATAVRAGQVGMLDVIVKPSDQPISVDTFAAVLAHAGVFRAYGLMMRGHAPWNFGGGLGSTKQIDSYATELVEAGIIPEIEILLPNVYTRAEAIKAIQVGLQDVEERYSQRVDRWEGEGIDR